VTREFRRFDKFQEYVREHPEEIPPPPPRFKVIIKMNADFEREARQRIMMTLLGVNLVILGLAGIGGYFLAGMSLKPIKDMIDEQHRFITDASHELRTPLTVLKSEIEVSLRDKNMTVAEARNILESNLEEVNNLQILTDNLLELASYQQKTLRDSFKTVHISDIMDDAIKAVHKAAKQKDISIKNEMTDQFVKGNEISLVRLFVILLDNAIKYSPEKSAVTITEKKTDGYIKVRVTDQGIGIDEKDIPKVFHRFYRSNSARSKTQASGYGLGLSIAKKIVDNHDGSIKVESEKDKGTTFIVTLPVDN
jgi:signal transduction histidine kinase